MPYPNVPDEMQERMEACVMQVMKEGTDKVTAIAICHTSVVEGKSLDESRAQHTHTKSLAVKAVGDWELEVLGVPFGGPKGGKDSVGEYFSEATNLYLDQFKSPLVTYYHGFTPDGKPQGEPMIIGKAEYTGQRPDGHWWKVVLDKTSDYARRIWEAAKQGLGRASSGSLVHLVRKAADGLITHWPVGEIALIDAKDNRQPANNFAVALPVMKAMYTKAGATLPFSGDPEAGQSAENHDNINQTGEITMEKEMIEGINAAVASAFADQEKARKVEEERKIADDKKISEAVKAQVDEATKKLEVESRRLYTGVPRLRKYNEIDRYDNLSMADMATLVEVMGASKTAKLNDGPSPAAYKALAIKSIEDKDEAGSFTRSAMKARGMALKADEVMQQDLGTYGDEWVGVGYGTVLWDAIRHATFVLGKLPQMEIPQGEETMKIPLEGADPTWYKVAETTDINATTKVPNATVTTSQVGTSNVSPTLSKAGARVLWSGELDEDSLIPMLPHLRNKLGVSGGEILEHVIIDGDSTLTATTNINDIASTGAQTVEIYVLFNGFRKSCLVTTTANSRSAAGGFVASDFIETLKLMGGSGMNALDHKKVGFIVDPATHWKAIDLAEVRTRDVFANPTLESGKLTGIYGYNVNVGVNMHRASTVRLANTAGKVDQDTVGNNLYGSILGVRYDQWMFGWKRRPKTTVKYVEESDHYQITSLLRIGLVQRDTEASAITYYVGV